MSTRTVASGVALALALVVSAGAAPVAHAVTVEWFFYGDGSGNFTEPPSEVLNRGPEETYQDASKSNVTGNTPVNAGGNFAAGGRTVTASGFAFNDVDELWEAADLLENNRGTRERGLGVAGTSPEIDDTEMVVIDLGADNLAELSNWMIQFNSVDGDEGVDVLTYTTSNIADALMLGTLLLDSSDVNQGTAGPEDLNFFAIDPDRFLFITASGSGSPTDIMVSALKAELEVSVPEPTSLGLLGLGLMGLGAVARRRRAI